MKNTLFAAVAAVVLLLSMSSAHMAVEASVDGSITADTSRSEEPSTQDKAFIWVRATEEGQYPGYKRIIGGSQTNGTTLWVCRATVNGFQVPGKLYGKSCLVSWASKEMGYDSMQYDLFLTNTAYHWRPIHDLSRAQIEKGAVLGGWEPSDRNNLYICRKPLKDGVHPGKYSIATGNCFVGWGGKAYHYPDGFDVLFP